MGFILTRLSILLPSGQTENIAIGETIMSIPSSYRIDITTIMASEIGPAIKETLSESVSEMMNFDEEPAMTLYFMHESKKGVMSRLYHSFKTATPPNLPMIWT